LRVDDEPIATIRQEPDRGWSARAARTSAAARGRSFRSSPAIAPTALWPAGLQAGAGPATRDSPV